MYYVYLWKDSASCRPLISKSPLRREEVPADVSIRTIHSAPGENEALEVFRALLEYTPEAGLWSGVDDSLTRTVSWDGPPPEAKAREADRKRRGWAENLSRWFG